MSIYATESFNGEQSTSFSDSDKNVRAWNIHPRFKLIDESAKYLRFGFFCKLLGLDLSVVEVVL